MVKNYNPFEEFGEDIFIINECSAECCEKCGKGFDCENTKEIVWQGFEKAFEMFPGMEEEMKAELNKKKKKR